MTKPLKINHPYPFRREGDVLLNGQLQVEFCDEGVDQYFDIPFEAKRVYFTLHQRPAKNRIRLSVVDGWGYWYTHSEKETQSEHSPWSHKFDERLTKTFPKGVCYVGCEYES